MTVEGFCFRRTVSAIEFRALGTLDLRDPGNGREFGAMLARPKRVALLAYLALAKPRGVHHRDTLLGIFWPETSQERVRHALNQALYVLRRALGGGVVVTRGAEEIGIDVAELWCDAAAFEAAFEAGKFEEALGLYGGDLLNGFYLSDCPEFEQWRDGERARLRERASEAAWSLADGAEEAGNAVAAATRWRRRTGVGEPLDSPLMTKKCYGSSLPCSIVWVIGRGRCRSTRRSPSGCGRTTKPSRACHHPTASPLAHQTSGGGGARGARRGERGWHSSNKE